MIRNDGARATDEAGGHDETGRDDEGASAAGGDPTAGGPRNVLLITVDSLRYDRTFDGLAPAAERLREEGVSFERAYATGPGTTPSFPAILTGTMPLSYGGLGPLDPGRPSLAANLRAAGLATGGFQCNPFLSARFGYDRGFDAYEDYQNPLMGLATRLFPRGIEINNPRLRRVDEALHLTDAIKWAYRLLRGKPRPYVSAEVVTDDALAWLSGRDLDDPFFLWAHYMDVHHPCFPPERYRDRFDVADVSQAQVAEWYADFVGGEDPLADDELDALGRLYDAAIAYTDDQVGRILDRLRETDRFAETLVVFTSDHGELFGEHGGCGKPERLYDELLHVPLVVANGPDHLESAREDLVSLLDVPPLVHDALGVAVPDAYEGSIPGVDPPRKFVRAEHAVDGEVITGARSAGWLYEADEIAGEHRLFDCREGFERARRDACDRADGAALVRDATLERLAQLDVDPADVGDAVSGDVERRLEDLGYL